MSWEARIARISVLVCCVFSGIIAAIAQDGGSTETANTIAEEVPMMVMMRRNQQEPATLRPDFPNESEEPTTANSNDMLDEDLMTTMSTNSPAANSSLPVAQKAKLDRRIDGSLGGQVVNSGGPTVLQILKNLRASTFVQLLISTGLNHVVENSGPFTVFAPTDDAFSRLPTQVQKRLQTNPEKLRQVLHYHIVPGIHESKHLQNGLRLTTMAMDGASVIVKVYADKKPTINSAAVTVPDARASNGIVHIVSDVIYPLPVGSIMATLRTCSALSTLVSLLESSGLGAKLDSIDEGITLLAPSAEAFQFLPQMDELKSNATILEGFLLNHVIPGVYFSGSLRDNQLLITGSDMDIHVGIRNGRLRDVGIARVIKSDIPATNGVIHIIDRLLTSDDDSCFYP